MKTWFSELHSCENDCNRGVVRLYAGDWSNYPCRFITSDEGGFAARTQCIRAAVAVATWLSVSVTSMYCAKTTESTIMRP